jgi:hypothetical protein
VPVRWVTSFSSFGGPGRLLLSDHLSAFVSVFLFQVAHHFCFLVYGRHYNAIHLSNHVTAYLL